MQIRHIHYVLYLTMLVVLVHSSVFNILHFHSCSSRLFAQDTQVDDSNKKETEDSTSEGKDLSVTEKIESPGLEVGGFFDIYASNYHNNPNVFELGNFELDLEHNFERYFQVASALVFNTDGVELAVAFIDFHRYGGSISPRGRLFEAEGLHFQVGKFDIPFGNDWRYFASKDRYTVTSPLTTQFVNNDGYNDTGARFLANFASYNISLQTTKGIEKGTAYGGRIGLTPFNNPFTFQPSRIPIFEIGLSFIYDVDRHFRHEQSSFSLDAESRAGPVVLQWEYALRKNDYEENIVDGIHTTMVLELQELTGLPFFPLFRYDFLRYRSGEVFNAFTRNGGLSHRLTGGLSLVLYKIVTVKLEYNRFIKSKPELRSQEEYSPWSVYGQLVISF